MKGRRKDKTNKRRNKDNNIKKKTRAKEER
jgi:hypothetical protein